MLNEYINFTPTPLRFSPDSCIKRMKSKVAVDSRVYSFCCFCFFPFCEFLLFIITGVNWLKTVKFTKKEKKECCYKKKNHYKIIIGFLIFTKMSQRKRMKGGEKGKKGLEKITIQNLFSEPFFFKEIKV